jgi:hypothetical protein
MSKEKKKAGTLSEQRLTTYERVEKWLQRNDKRFFYFLLTLSTVLALISFNARISEAHDDALYLEAGWRFVHEFPTFFYTQNAPLYPLFLGLMVKIMGFKLIIFKVLSLLFNFFGLFFFYKALRSRIPAVVFIPVMLFHASNYLIIYFASMTFTEAMYFFLQGLFFYYAAKVLDLNQKQPTLFKKQSKQWLMLGFTMFLISTCKSSAVVAVPAVALFFALEKNYKAVGATVLSFLIFKIPYEVLLKLVWKAQNQFKGQSAILLLKDPYNKMEGNEDLSGFFKRLIENSDLYISKRFYQLLGWRDENSTEVFGQITIISIALMLAGFVFFYKKNNRIMLLAALFVGAQTILSFIILQTRWDQPRIILINMPVLLILMLYSIYHLTKKGGFGQVVYSALVVLLISSLLMSSFKRGVKNIPIVKKNLKGDKYYGYTPDWANFLRCSEWCADSLSSEALVVSRKAPMSFIYGKGKKFFPVYSVIMRDSTTDQSHPDSALAFFQKNKVTHVMLGSLRVNPNNASMGFINTVHNIMQPIAQKYPQKLKLVHVEGTFEETYVYEINY